MPRRFSSTTPFILSYSLKTRLNTGWAFDMMKKSPMPSTGTAARKTEASRRFIRAAAVSEKISMTGLRTAMRISIMNACCMFVTSVVRRVMMLEGENLSMFSKEKLCTLRNMSCRRFFAKPAAATAQLRAERAPNVRDTAAQAMRRSPMRTI